MSEGDEKEYKPPCARCEHGVPSLAARLTKDFVTYLGFPQWNCECDAAGKKEVVLPCRRSPLLSVQCSRARIRNTAHAPVDKINKLYFQYSWRRSAAPHSACWMGNYPDYVNQYLTNAFFCILLVFFLVLGPSLIWFNRKIHIKCFHFPVVTETSLGERTFEWQSFLSMASDSWNIYAHLLE